MMYLIDTNVLIELWKNNQYNISPAFWNKFKEYAENETLKVHYECYLELTNESGEEEESELVKFIKSIHNFILTKEDSYSQDVQNELKRLYADKTLNNTLSEKPMILWADAWIIAYAKHHKCCIITDESKKPERMKIPGVCIKSEIICVDFNGFRENIQWLI